MELLPLPPFLTDEEIATICAPLRQAAARVRFLEGLGLTVRRKPNGAPLVSRSHFESVMNTSVGNRKGHASAGPDRAALVQFLRKAS